MSEASVTLATPKDLARVPLVTNQRSFAWITDKVSTICEENARLWWWALFIPLSAIAASRRSCNLATLSGLTHLL